MTGSDDIEIVKAGELYDIVDPIGIELPGIGVCDPVDVSAPLNGVVGLLVTVERNRLDDAPPQPVHGVVYIDHFEEGAETNHWRCSELLRVDDPVEIVFRY